MKVSVSYIELMRLLEDRVSNYKYVLLNQKAGNVMAELLSIKQLINEAVPAPKEKK